MKRFVSGLGPAVISISSIFVLSLAIPAHAVAPAFVDSQVLNSNAAGDTGDDFTPRVATDDQGNWIAVWRSNENLGTTAGTDNDIFYATSIDGGSTWTVPSLLNTNGTTDSGDDEAPVIVSDRDSVWITVWDSDENLGGSAGVDSDIFFSRSTNAGATWSAPQLLNTNGNSDTGSDMEPKLTTDGNGVWVALWHSTDPLTGLGTDFDLLYSRSVDDGVTWSSPQALNSNAATDGGNDADGTLTTDGTTWVAVWESATDLGGIGTDFDIFFSRSVDGGQSWSAVQALNSNAPGSNGNNRFPTIATDGSSWVTVWESVDKLGNTIGTDQDILYARSTDSGATWSTVAPLNTNAAADGGNDRRPRLYNNGLGDWIAVWESNDTLSGLVGSDYDILLARSFTNGASWANPEPLDPDAVSDSGDDTNVSVATDVLDWVAVWNSSDTKGGGIGTDFDIFVSQSETLCPALPATGCKSPFVAGKSLFQLKNDFPDKRDRITFKWNKGSETVAFDLGNPLVATDYILCGYDQSGPGTKLIFESLAPAGGTCRSKPCWQALSNGGFKYVDPDLTPMGIKQVKLKPGIDGKAKVVAKGKGGLLAAPLIPLTPPVRFQIENTAGTCWEATYSIPILNAGTKFKSRDP